MANLKILPNEVWGHIVGSLGFWDRWSLARCSHQMFDVIERAWEDFTKFSVCVGSDGNIFLRFIAVADDEDCPSIVFNHSQSDHWSRFASNFTGLSELECDGPSAFSQSLLMPVVHLLAGFKGMAIKRLALNGKGWNQPLFVDQVVVHWLPSLIYVYWCGRAVDGGEDGDRLLGTCLAELIWAKDSKVSEMTLVRPGIGDYQSLPPNITYLEIVDANLDAFIPSSIAHRAPMTRSLKTVTLSCCKWSRELLRAVHLSHNEPSLLFPVLESLTIDQNLVDSGWWEMYDDRYDPVLLPLDDGGFNPFDILTFPFFVAPCLKSFSWSSSYSSADWSIFCPGTHPWEASPPFLWRFRTNRCETDNAISLQLKLAKIVSRHLDLETLKISFFLKETDTDNDQHDDELDDVNPGSAKLQSAIRDFLSDQIFSQICHLSKLKHFELFVESPPDQLETSIKYKRSEGARSRSLSPRFSRSKPMVDFVELASLFSVCPSLESVDIGLPGESQGDRLAGLLVENCPKLKSLTCRDLSTETLSTIIRLMWEERGGFSNNDSHKNYPDRLVLRIFNWQELAILNSIDLGDWVMAPDAPMVRIARMGENYFVLDLF